MKYEVLEPDPESGYGERARLTFIGDHEIRNLSLVYSELIRGYYDLGNPGSASEYDRYGADPSRLYVEPKRKLFNTSDIFATNMVEVFQKFVDRTEEEVERIWENTEPRMYAGSYVAERINAAKWSSDIIKEISSKALDHLSKRSDEYMEAGLRDILSGHEPQQ